MKLVSKKTQKAHKKTQKTQKITQNPLNSRFCFWKYLIRTTFSHRIHRNLFKWPLLNLHRGGGRKCPIFKSRYLREYLIFFIQIFFIVKLWIYSIDSARFRRFPRCLEKHVIIPKLRSRPYILKITFWKICFYVFAF